MPRSRSPRGRSRSRSRTRSRSRGRKRSRSASSYSSSSRSPSSSYSRSASSYSRSSYSRSRSRSYRRRRVPPRRSRSYDRRRPVVRTRRRSRTPSPKRVLVRNITRNVNQEHLKEIFGTFGDVTQVVVPMHAKINGTNTGKAEIFFKASSGAEKARRHMDGAQIDGNVVEVIMMVPDRGVRRPVSQYSQRRFGVQGRPRSPSPRRSDIRGRPGPRRSPFRRRSRSPIRR